VTSPNSYANAYDGTFNADDRLVAPWWIPDWTAQDKISIPVGNNLVVGPGFPTNLSFVNVTGNYFDTNSSPLGGFMTVMMSDNITVLDNGVYYRLPKRYTGTMNQPLAFSYNNWGSERLYLRLGGLNIELFATDQTASGSTVATDSGSTFFYWVTEHWLGGRRYQIIVPSSASPGPADINSLIVPGSITPYKYDPVFPDLVSEDYTIDTPPPVATTFAITQSSVATTWNTVVDQGSAAQYTFTFTATGGAPYPMTGTTWEYIVRNSGGTQEILLTTTPNSEGSLTVSSTSSLSQVTLVLNPAATSGLAPGVYNHAIWMDPGTANAYCWLTGTLTVSTVPQP